MQSIYNIMLIAFFIALAVVIVSSIVNYKQKILLNRIAKEISDGYIIFDTQYNISKYNKAFLRLFDLKLSDIKNKKLSDFFDRSGLSQKDINKLEEYCKIVKNGGEAIQIDAKKLDDNKIYKLEIKSIVNNDIFMRYALICKDVTKKYEVIKELEDNQDMMTNREKFATLGQLVSRNSTFIKISDIFFIRRTGIFKFTYR
jgi:PAS domain S-box-containing protein